MAEGEVRVDVALALDKAKKDLREFEKDVVRYSNSWKTATLKVQQLEEQLRSLKGSTSANASEIKRVETSLLKASANANVFERAMNDAKLSVEASSKKVQEMSIADALKTPETFAEDWAKIVEEKERQKRVEQELREEIGETTDTINQQAASIDTISQGFQAASDNVRDSMSGIAEAVRSAFGDTAINIKDTYELIDSMRRQFQTLEAAGEAPKGLAAMRRELEANRRELDLVSDKLKELQTQAAKEVRTTGVISPDTQRAIEQVNIEFDNINTNLERIANKSGITRDAFDSVATAAENIASKSSKFQTFGATMASSAKIATSAFGKIGSVINMIGNAATRVASTTINAFRRIGSAIGGIVTGASKAVQSISQMTRNIFHFGRQSKKSAGMVDFLGRRIMRLAASAFVFNVIRKALNGLTKDLGAVLMANEQFARDLNAIKVNLSTAFAPILTTIQPAILSFMDLLARFTSVLAQFMATLFGQTYQQAKDSAKGIYDTANAVKQLGKESRKTLAPFDELIIVGEQAAETEIGGLDFEAVEPPDFSWIDEFVKKIKEIDVDLEYFETLGNTIAQKISDALNKIPWDTIQNWLNAKVTALGAFLNGIVGNDAFWAALGNALKKGIETALLAANTFLETFKFYDFGSRLGQLFNDATTNLPLYGRMLKNAIKAALDTANGFIDTFKWTEFGTNLATLFEEVTSQLPYLGQTLKNLIENALNGANAFLETFNWYNFGANLAKFFNELVATLPSLANTLGLTIDAALKTANGFIDTFSWYDFGAGLGDIFQTIISKLPELGTTLGNLLMGISNTINGFFDSVNWAEAGQKFSGGIINLFNGLRDAISNTNWRQIGEDIKTFLINIDWIGIFNAIMEVIGAAFIGIGDFLSGLLGEGIASALLAVISVMLGGAVISKIFTDIIPLLTTNITTLITQIKTLFMEGFGVVGAGIALALFTIMNDDINPALTAVLALISGILVAWGTTLILGTGPIGIIVAAVTGLITLIGTLILKFSQEEKPIKDSTTALENLAQAHEDVETAIKNHEDAQENFQKATENVTTAQEKLTTAEENLVKARERLEDITNSLYGISTDYLDANERMAEAAERLEEAERAAGMTREEFLEAAKDGLITYENMTESQKELYRAVSEHDAAQLKLNDTMTLQEEILHLSEQATKDVETALEDVEIASKNVDGATKDLEESTRKMIEANIDMTKSSEDLIRKNLDMELSMAAQSKDFNKNGESAKEYRDKVIDAFEKGEISADHAKETLSKAMTGMSNDVRKAFTEDMPKDIKDGLDPKHYETTGEKISNWFKNVGNGMISGFKKIFGINSPSTEMIAIAGDIANGLTKGMDDKSNSIKTAASNILSSIKTTLSDGIEGVKQVGKNIGDAIATGINNAKAWITETATNVGNAITNAFNSIFQIRSPSRVFMRIGEYLGEGLAIGISNTEDMTTNTMADMVYSASDEINSFEKQGEEIGTSLLRGLQSMYNPIVDFFKNLFDDIQNIVSTFTVTPPQMPQINIPSLSRNGMLDISTINMISEKGRNYSDNQIVDIPQQESLRYLQQEQQMTNTLLRELINTMSNLNLNVDGLKLAKVTTSNQRSLAIQYGETLLQQ